jgi:hypothetical protein
LPSATGAGSLPPPPPPPVEVIVPKTELEPLDPPLTA